jgi:hypothetical protein
MKRASLPLQASQREREGGRERGFSLIEVVLALGLLATVLISIASLFLIGGKQVHQGKDTTSATALGQTIMERIDQLAYNDTYKYFGGADTDTSLSISTAPTGTNANQFQSDIATRLGPGASATIAVTPLGTASPLNMGSAAALQVRVTVNWTELGRARSVSIQSVRF